jgi:DNA-binding LacI/PurR family transcriptional regulator
LEQPAQTIGSLGTQLLLERIEGRGPDRRHEVVLPGEFIIRKSCGAK